MRQVVHLIASVAKSDTTVLIQGESGTGKEIVANAVHAMSRRRRGPFVKVNCAALTETLLESELFGHVKGAFTGAMRDRNGRFKQADRGTILLDEIGSMPLAGQAALLRVLQEHEFEPVGSSTTTSVDVRVIASTNTDLAKAVAEGSFRADLYYRLNVFGIVVPPLRERVEDIPLLSRHFLERCNETLGKRTPGSRSGHARRAPRARMAGQRARAGERHRACGHRGTGHDPDAIEPASHHSPVAWTTRRPAAERARAAGATEPRRARRSCSRR